MKNKTIFLLLVIIYIPIKAQLIDTVLQGKITVNDAVLVYENNRFKIHDYKFLDKFIIFILNNGNAIYIDTTNHLEVDTLNIPLLYVNKHNYYKKKDTLIFRTTNKIYKVYSKNGKLEVYSSVAKTISNFSDYLIFNNEEIFLVVDYKNNKIVIKNTSKDKELYVLNKIKKKWKKKNRFLYKPVAIRAFGDNMVFFNGIDSEIIIFKNNKIEKKYKLSNKIFTSKDTYEIISYGNNNLEVYLNSKKQIFKINLQDKKIYLTKTFYDFNSLKSFQKINNTYYFVGISNNYKSFALYRYK